MTGFEEAVYKAVSRIPRGETRTYKWVAKAAGRPAAWRAAGNALKRNPDAPKVPCHRVVRSDGAIGGYVDGAARKARLLKAEGVDVTGLKLL